MPTPQVEDQLPYPAPGVVFQRVPDGAVLLHTTTETYFGLNKVGAEAWELLPPGIMTMGELASRVSQRHPGVPLETVLSDLRELIDELRRLGLVADGAGDPGASSPSPDGHGPDGPRR